MNHIVERLVEKSKSTAEPLSSLLLQAAAEVARLRDELKSATRHMELAEAAWLRETAGNSPVAIVITDEERETLEIAAKILVSEPSINPAQRKEWASTLLGIIR